MDVISQIKSINPSQNIIVLTMEFKEKIILPLFEFAINSVLIVPYEEEEFLLTIMKQSEKIYFHNMLHYGHTTKQPTENISKEKIVFKKDVIKEPVQAPKKKKPLKVKLNL